VVMVSAFCFSGSGEGRLRPSQWLWLVLCASLVVEKEG